MPNILTCMYGSMHHMFKHIRSLKKTSSKNQKCYRNLARKVRTYHTTLRTCAQYVCHFHVDESANEMSKWRSISMFLCETVWCNNELLYKLQTSEQYNLIPSILKHVYHTGGEYASPAKSQFCLWKKKHIGRRKRHVEMLNDSLNPCFPIASMDHHHKHSHLHPSNSPLGR